MGYSSGRSRYGVVAAVLIVTLLGVTVLGVAVGWAVLGIAADGTSGDVPVATPQPEEIDSRSGTPLLSSPAVEPSMSQLPALPVTDDAAVYAAAVAAVLFGMDQRAYRGEDYLALLVDARSPDAAELIPEVTDEAFLAALRERVPDEYMWQRMRDSKQYATFEVSQVWEPDYVAAKRAAGELPAGVAGLNVSGTQTIYYLDENDEPAQRERAQAVSLLLACAPVQPNCGLVGVSTGVVE